jgi:hypothetical protein
MNDDFGIEFLSNFVRAKSARSHTKSEIAVKYNLLDSGLDPHFPCDRDSIHDCVIETSQNFWLKIQIKSCYGKSYGVNLWTRGSGSTAPVSPGDNTKPRTSTSYYMAGIHIMSVVTDDSVLYYPTQMFDSQTKSFSIKKVSPLTLDEVINYYEYPNERESNIRGESNEYPNERESDVRRESNEYPNERESDGRRDSSGETSTYGISNPTIEINC